MLVLPLPQENPVFSCVRGATVTRDEKKVKNFTNHKPYCFFEHREFTAICSKAAKV